MYVESLYAHSFLAYRRKRREEDGGRKKEKGERDRNGERDRTRERERKREGEESERVRERERVRVSESERLNMVSTCSQKEAVWSTSCASVPVQACISFSWGTSTTSLTHSLTHSETQLR